MNEQLSYDRQGNEHIRSSLKGTKLDATQERQ